jgi:hypothetical protein
MPWCLAASSVGAGQHHVDLGVASVGYENLGAVQEPFIAPSFTGGGLGAAGIGAGRRFGQPEGAEFLSPGEGCRETRSFCSSVPNR